LLPHCVSPGGQGATQSHVDIPLGFATALHICVGSVQLPPHCNPAAALVSMHGCGVGVIVTVGIVVGAGDVVGRVVAVGCVVAVGIGVWLDVETDFMNIDDKSEYPVAFCVETNTEMPARRITIAAIRYTVVYRMKLKFCLFKYLFLSTNRRNT
jgi:hypothetical protein